MQINTLLEDIQEFFDMQVIVAHTCSVVGVLLGIYYEKMHINRRWNPRRATTIIRQYKECMGYSFALILIPNLIFIQWSKQRGESIEPETCKIQVVHVFVECMFVFSLNNIRYLFTQVKLRKDSWYKTRHFKYSVLHFLSTMIGMLFSLSGYGPKNFDEIVIQDCDKMKVYLKFDKCITGLRTIGKYYAFIRLVVLISLWLDMKNL